MSTHLADITVDTVIQLSKARDDCRAWRELCAQALHLLAEREVELKRTRERYFALLDERRRERQAEVA